MSNDLPVYPVSVEPRQGGWQAVVGGLPHATTEVPRFDELPEAVCDVIRASTGLDRGEYRTEWTFGQDGHDFTAALESYRRWARHCELAVESHESARQALVEEMRRAGLTYRAIADVLRVSHQRVAQLAGESGGLPGRDLSAHP